MLYAGFHQRKTGVFKQAIKLKKYSFSSCCRRGFSTSIIRHIGKRMSLLQEKV
jgi:hypothetical protein